MDCRCDEPAAAKREKPAPAKTKLSFKEQREFDGMEQAIMDAESLVAALQEETGRPDFYRQPADVTKARLAALDEGNRKVAALYARWEELGARAGG